MTHRTTRTLLQTTALAFWAASAALVCLAFFPPTLAPPAEGLAVAATGRNGDVGRRSERTLTDFEPLWGKPLRPVNPSPPAPPQPEPLPTKEQVASAAGSSSGLGVQLIGTVLEKGRSLAVLIDGQGNIVLRAVGETLSGGAEAVRVERIELNRVTLSGESQRVTLHMPTAEVP